MNYVRIATLKQNYAMRRSLSHKGVRIAGSGFCLAVYVKNTIIGIVDYVIKEIKMTKLDQFINKNYNKIKRHLKQEGKELGYTKNQLENYYLDTKCFIFAGTKDELEQETSNYFVIAEQDNLVIAETFHGLNYNFI